MGIDRLDIKLAEAKQAIAIPDFKRDDLLRLALVVPFTLQPPVVTESERLVIEHEYRRLAFLGNYLLDAFLADYLFDLDPEASNHELNQWREKLTSRNPLTQFAIQLGLHNFCSSWNRPDRKPPEQEPRVYGEMVEALVAAIHLNFERNYAKTENWVLQHFFIDAVAEELGAAIDWRDAIDDPLLIEYYEDFDDSD